MIYKSLLTVFFTSSFLLNLECQVPSSSKCLLDSLLHLEAFPELEVLVVDLERISDLSISENDIQTYTSSLIYLSNFYYQLSDEYNEDRVTAKSLQLLKSFPNISSSKIATILNNGASIEKRKGNYQIASNLYRTAIEYEKLHDSTPFDRGVLYHNIAGIYRILGDFENSSRYAREAIKAMNSIKESNVRFLNVAEEWYTIGLSSSALNNLEDAELQYNKCLIHLSQHQDQKSKKVRKLLIDVYLGLVDVHVKLKRFVQSKKGINRVQEIQKFIKYRAYKTHETLGFYYKEKNQFIESERSFKTSLELAKEEYRTSKLFPVIARINMKLGDLYAKSDEIAKALDYYHKALVYFDHSIVDSLRLNPEIDDMEITSIAFQVLHKKAKSARKLYEMGHKFRHNDISIRAYQATVQYIDRMKESYLHEGSKFYIAEKATKVYNEYISLLYDEYQRSKSVTVLETIFSVMEKNKAAVLLSSISNKFKILSLSIPSDILENEQSLKSQISFFSKLLSEAKIAKDSDINKIELYEKELFEAKENYTFTVQNNKSEYPEYYEYKNNLSQNHSIESVQSQLGDGHTLIEYYQADSIWYALSISNSSTHLEKIRSTSLVELVRSYKEKISEPPSSHNSKKPLDSISMLLSSIILPPSILCTGIDHLSIIPDGILSQIPMESLIITNNQKSNYLIKSANINYYYSASQFLEEEITSYADMSILGLAPIFTGSTTDQRSCSNSEFGNLPFAQDEMTFLENNFSGTFLSSEHTSSTDLTDNIGAYPIIHLATHACLNSKDALLSRILFTDGYLTNYDIQNLNVRPELVVLSACNTAQGQLKKGEGIISLSRGFFEAGVRSLQSSLWSIDDYSSSEIVKGMYSNLKNGMTKSEALRNSKLKYLGTADKLRSHPYYWAGMIQTGNDTSLFSTKDFNWIYILLGILLLAAASFVYKSGRS